jgi:hypothetical protein
MKIGRVISSELTTNRDGERKVLMLTVEIAEAGDLQAVELFRQPGDECRPNEDATVLIADLGDAWRVAVAADDGIEPEAEAGERGIYASDAGVKKSQVMCKKDGTIEAGLNASEMVALASLVHSQISDMLQAGVGAGGPGAANFTAAKAAWNLIFVPPMTGVASANLKAEAP